MHCEGNAGADGLQKAEAGSNAALEQVAAEFNPLRPPALRSCGGGDRVHADLNKHRFDHDLGCLGQAELQFDYRCGRKGKHQRLAFDLHVFSLRNDRLLLIERIMRVNVGGR